MAFYQLNKSLERKERIIFEVGGFALILLIWWLITLGSSPVIPSGILPSPGKVLAAFYEMLRENDLVTNFFYSLGLNLGGYMEAVAIAIPLGFALGLVPRLRASFIRPVTQRGSWCFLPQLVYSLHGSELDQDEDSLPGFWNYHLLVTGCCTAY